jgi:cell division control protein 7
VRSAEVSLHFSYTEFAGSYGVCFKAIRSDPDDTDENGKPRQYAIKRIFPTINAAFILVEMLILRLLDGQKHITDLVQGFRLDGQVSLVFKYQKSQPFLAYLNKLNLEEIKNYMFTLLTAVEHLAYWGVMHRDIKPTNFLYDPKSHTGLLIDFGLSELEIDSQTGKPRKHPDNAQVMRIAQLQR